jgi:spore germination protein GerM
MPFNKRSILWIFVFIILFLGGIAGGYFFFSKGPVHQRPTAEAPQQAYSEDQDLITVRMYYPSEDRLVMEERKVKRRASVAAVAEEIAAEYLKGPSTGRSEVPADARVLGVYSGNDGILYLDISDEFRRNFQGDAMAEYMLLKGLYESIISNVSGIDDVKILIEGKEIESIGGHLFALYPLKNMLTEVK